MIESCSLPNQYIPVQYIYRAAEAKKILSETKHDPITLGKRIALGEFGQLIFFVAQIIIFSLAYWGILSPVIAGSVSLIILPFEAFCSYNTFVHYKPFSRVILTLAAVVSLAACAILAIFGCVNDSFVTVNIGGFLLHLFRNVSEHVDAKNCQKNALYRSQVLRQ